MNFKELTKYFLSEGVRKVDNITLEKGVRVNDVVKGWTKIRNPTQWEKITQTEFINYMNIWIGDKTHRGQKRGEPRFVDNFSHEDFVKAYNKFIEIVTNEKLMRNFKPSNLTATKTELDRNPGKPENMILTMFFNYAGQEAKKGYTSRTHLEALKNNAVNA